MPALELSIAERKAHRAQAHHLDPVVMIGADGLTEAVLREADTALAAHGLIKLRAHHDDRQQREQWLAELADRLGAAPVQHIGKLLVLWRPKPPREKAAAANPARRPGPRQVKVLKYSKRGGQRPEVKLVRVLGNQRLTPGGLVKKAKPRTRSVKKTAD